MKALFVALACLAALCFAQPPAYCDNTAWDTLPNYGVTKPMYGIGTVTHCLYYDMDPGYSSYAYVALRRRTRFNDSSSYLYMCTSADINELTTCTYFDSDYVMYIDQHVDYVYTRLDLKTYGLDLNQYIYFDMRRYQGSSSSAWSGSCPLDNCNSRGACLTDGTCDCDEGHSGCGSSGLLDWLVAVIVICILVVIFIPIIIIICCCCCVGCCAAAAAAGAH